MDIGNVIKQMTLEEKARLVNGAGFFRTAEIKRFSIEQLQLLDGGTGINFEQLFGDMAEAGGYQADSTNGMVGSTSLTNVIEYYFEPEKLSEEELKLHAWIKERLERKLNGDNYAPGCFPPGILLGATWNKEVVRKVGEVLGKEAGLYGVQILLGTPNVNIHRDPLNGRLFEGYSEDPYLVSQLAPQLVKGVQKYGVAANVKHFAANNQETNRVGIDEHISARALEEIYFPGFRACVQEGHVKTVMSAYNRINGVPCTENKWLLTEKLREEWGFEGVVVSDWGAVYHPDKALAAGNDLAMPGPLPWEPIVEAVCRGTLKESEVNLAATRLLRLIDWINEHFNKLPQVEPQKLKQETDQVAYMAAAEGIVLVENAGILPLNETEKVGLIGSGAEKLMDCGSGSAGITTNRTSKIKDGLCVVDAKEAETLVCVCKLGGMEGNDRLHMHLDIEDLKILASYGAIDLEKVPQYIYTQLAPVKRESSDITQSLILVLNVCGPVDLSYLQRDVVKAVLVAFLPGMAGGKAIADILTGRRNPSGKLPLTFPVRYEDTPTCLNFPGDGYKVHYGEGIYVGYRYYDKKKINPLYPFGFGMSYTTFLCRGFKDIDVKTDSVCFGVSVKNIGEMAGAEVIQIYASDPYATLHKPIKELVAFEKVYLEPGEEKEIKFVVSFDRLKSYDADLMKWTLEEGFYDLIAATSSAEKDIFATERVYLDVDSPYRYGLTSTVKTIYEKQQLKTALRSLWEEKEWDWGIVESNYQYTSNKIIKEILPMQNDIENDKEISKFIETVSKIKKR